MCHAQTAASPEDEYKKLIRVNEDVQPLGEHPFGENISLYDGSLSFEQTDVSVSGNGPLMQFGRKFQIEGDLYPSDRVDYAFGDWSITVPHLETLTGTGFVNTTSGWKNVAGWQVNATNADARCSQFAQPNDIVQLPNVSGLNAWAPATWWKGYHLVLPGQGSQDMLANADAASKGIYPVVTKSHWRFSCLSNVANPGVGISGEGFLAQSPDGTKYWFNQLVYRHARGMSRPLYFDEADATKPQRGSLANRRAPHADPVSDLLALLTGSSPARAAASPFRPAASSLQRQTAWMMVTRIEDRFGNALTFSYDASGNVTGISASDGRVLTVQYVSGTPRVHSVTLQTSSGAPRIWTYTYDAAGTSLTAVTLPDATQWHYNLASFLAASTHPKTSSCLELNTMGSNGVPLSGSVTHPSGLTGTFTVKPLRRGRSYVPRECRGTLSGNENTPNSYADVPNAWYSVGITDRVLSGAAVPALSSWHYSYSDANQSWSDCGGGCATTVYTDVINPDGSSQRYTFSNKYDSSESQLLSTKFYAGAAEASTLVRSEVLGYSPPLPVSAGFNLQSNVNWAQTNNFSPLNQRVITQEGDAYTWQAEAFNAYEQVTQAKRFNLISGQSGIREVTTYLNDTNRWVLGLPLTVTTTDLSTGKVDVESSNTYTASNDTLLTHTRFGQLKMRYGFNGAGQLASFSDGNNHTTTLGNYKRGIPRTIGYPDNTTESLVVDDFGQISSITDQAGYVTNYGYDSVGRIASVTYGSGDEVSWLPKTFAYSFVTSDERGVSANHWKRITTTGNARSVTYFDAMLRPILSDIGIGTGVQSSSMVNYDAKGQKIFASYPSATGLNFTSAPGMGGSRTFYDVLGRPTQVQQISELGTLTSTTAYLAGARQQVTDPKGNITTTSYQVFDQPSADAVIKVQAPTGITQTIARDIYGNPLSITQAGVYGTQSLSVTKTLIYGSSKQLCRTVEPESGSTAIGRDGANNVIWTATGLALPADGQCRRDEVLAAAKTTLTRDNMSRVLTLQPPAGTPRTVYTYDALGHPKTAAVNGISTWSGSYNKRGMLTGEALQLPGQPTRAIGYAHDAYGSLAQMTYPDGERVNYAPDALGRATQVGSYAHGLHYFADGAVKDFTFGNGTTYAAEQNARQLLRNFSYGRNGVPQLSEDVSYDGNGNITQITDLAGNTRGQTMGYDALNRLTSAQAAAGQWGSESYTYDPLNNIRTKVSLGLTSTYSYDPQWHLSRITTGGNHRDFVYDNRGNTISRNGAALIFDAKDQLIQVVGNGTYSYDAAGRRVRKVSATGAATYYLYNQAGQMLFQSEPGVHRDSNFIMLGTRPIARSTRLGTAAPKAIYSYVDAQGTPQLKADAQGTIVGTFSNRPYGEPWGQVPSGPAYTNHVNDPETGLVYMQARYYDPAVGRFLSVDPESPEAGDVFNINRYGYANGNPIANMDPTGASCASSGNGQSQGQDQAPCPPPPPPPPSPPQVPLQPVVKVTAVVINALTRLGTAGELVTLPRWLIAAPNPIVVVTVGLIYPGNMATCQEISCSTAMYSKGGRQNVRDTGLIGVTDEEIGRRLRDPGTSSSEKKRLQKEQKARGQRNKSKREK